MSAVPENVEVEPSGARVTVTYACPACDEDAVVRGLSRTAWESYYVHGTQGLHQAFGDRPLEDRMTILTGMHDDCITLQEPEADYDWDPEAKIRARAPLPYRAAVPVVYPKGNETPRLIGAPMPASLRKIHDDVRSYLRSYWPEAFPAITGKESDHGKTAE